MFFTFLSNFKIPTLSNGMVTMATTVAFFCLPVVYNVYSGNQVPNGQDLTRDTLLSLI